MGSRAHRNDDVVHHPPSGDRSMRDGSRRVILHAGLHKTGTTSLQIALSRTVGCVFPPAEEPGPGHARLVWRALGIRGEKSDPETLRRTVLEQSRTAPRLPLVLSSEACVFALTHENGAEPFRRLAESTPTELVLTVRPDDERLESFAQEMIKQGRSVDLLKYWEPALASVPMSEGVSRGLVDLAPWSKVHIIRTDRQDPNFIFRSFAEILGAEVPEVPSGNARISAGELAVVNAINLLLESDPDHRAEHRDIGTVLGWARAIWNEVCALDPALRDVPYPMVPVPVLEFLRERWSRELAQLADEERPDLIFYPERFRKELASAHDGGRVREAFSSTLRRTRGGHRTA